MMQDRGIVTMADCPKIICPLSNYVITDDLSDRSRPIRQF